MKFRIAMALVAVVLAVTPQAYSLRTHRGPTSGTQQRRAQTAVSTRHKAVVQTHGQRAIDPARATQIQQALIRENYMTGEPTGQWDSSTEAAMTKFQADHGWQTKLTPDSRALIKLGLGPGSPETAENQASSASN